MWRTFLVLIAQICVAISSYANPICAQLFERTENTETTSTREKLQQHLDKELEFVSDRIASSLIKKLSKKIDSQKLTERDLLKATEKFYRALDKPWFSRFFSKLSVQHNESAILHREEFYKNLQFYIAHENIEMSKNAWQTFRTWTYSNAPLFSGVHFLAFHGALAASLHVLNADMSWFLLYLPALYSRSVSTPTSIQIAAHYYSRFAGTLLKVYYAAGLAFLALHPQVVDDQITNLQQAMQTYNSLTTELTLEQQQRISQSIIQSVGLNQYKETSARLTREVDLLLSQN